MMDYTTQSPQTHTSVPGQSDSMSDVQSTFYDNILTGGFRPTAIAIIIISIGLVLEMGTFFGFLIPADFLLYTSGLILGANMRWGAAVIMFIASIVFSVTGDLIGYYRSNKVGSAIYKRPDTRYAKKKHLYTAQAALEKYGDKIFYIGKFLHIRSFLPILAGLSSMNIVKFGLVSLSSTLIWASATFIPSFFIGMFFPKLITSWRLLLVGTLIFVVTEAIAWMVLFNQDIRLIARRLRESHQDFTAIKDNLIEIKHHIGDVAQYVVKGKETEESDGVISDQQINDQKIK